MKNRWPSTPIVHTSAPTGVPLCGGNSSASPRKRQTVSSPPTVDERADRRAVAHAVTRDPARPVLLAGRAAHVRADQHASAGLTTCHPPKRRHDSAADLHLALRVPRRYRAVEQISEALIRCSATQPSSDRNVR